MTQLTQRIFVVEFPEGAPLVLGSRQGETMNRTVAVLALAIGASAVPLSAIAEQVAVRQIEYSNDSISDGGKTVICEVTLVAMSPPDSRVLNFQFLANKNVVGWKITGGLMDWKTMSIVASRVTNGGFTSSNFYHDKDFKTQFTPEGQMMGWLQKTALYPDFILAFTASPYSVRVRWEGASEDAIYYIDQSRGPKIVEALNACYKTL